MEGLAKEHAKRKVRARERSSEEIRGIVPVIDDLMGCGIIDEVFELTTKPEEE